jgi:hypothetical protein
MSPAAVTNGVMQDKGPASPALLSPRSILARTPQRATEKAGGERRLAGCFSITRTRI